VEDGLRRDVAKLAWISRIQDALDENRFVLYEQPIVDLQTGATVQHELLLRMREADGGILGPGISCRSPRNTG
jgi:EAL domain-containing protein (putative c-di-GMP-specific phosphodiesterase class I)